MTTLEIQSASPMEISADNKSVATSLMGLKKILITPICATGHFDGIKINITETQFKSEIMLILRTEDVIVMARYLNAIIEANKL